MVVRPEMSSAIKCCPEFLPLVRRFARLPSVGTWLAWKVPPVMELLLSVNMWRFPQMGVPQNGWFLRDIPIKN